MQSLSASAIRTSGNSASRIDRKSTRLNSSHLVISYAVFCLDKDKLHVEYLQVPAAAFYDQHRPRGGLDRAPLTFDRQRTFDVLLPLFFNDTATTEIYTLSLHDALPI